jgi:hypothetical protein
MGVFEGGETFCIINRVTVSFESPDVWQMEGSPERDADGSDRRNESPNTVIQKIFNRPTRPLFKNVQPSAERPHSSSFDQFIGRQESCATARQNPSVRDAPEAAPITTRTTLRVDSSRTRDLLTAVVGGRSVLSKCDLDLVLRRFLIRPTRELCQRLEIDEGTYDAARLIDVLANAEASQLDPLHGLVAAALSNLRAANAIPRRRQSKRRPRNWTRRPADDHVEPSRASATPKDDRKSQPRPPAAAATRATAAAGERHLPKFYDDLDR